eukprot:2563621-Amphidinium_carterae.3
MLLRLLRLLLLLRLSKSRPRRQLRMNSGNPCPLPKQERNCVATFKQQREQAIHSRCFGTVGLRLHGNDNNTCHCVATLAVEDE